MCIKIQNNDNYIYPYKMKPQLKGRNGHKDITVQIVYGVNQRASKHGDQNLILLIGEIHKSTIIHGYFNSLLSKVLNR